MKQISRNIWRPLLLTLLAALVIQAGCELADPPDSSTTSGKGLGVQLMYPPGEQGSANKAASDTLLFQLYFLGTDSLAASEQRPEIDDPDLVPAASLDLVGDDSATLEILAVSEPTFWRLIAKSGSLLGQTTFTLNPSELQRGVRLVFAETELPDTLILYNSFSAQALSELAGQETSEDRVIYPVGVANNVNLAGLDFRFILSSNTEASILVDPGSRLGGGTGANLSLNLRRLDFVTESAAYRLEITAPTDEGAQDVLESGSDILFYIVADGTDSPDDLCIHAPSAFFKLVGGDLVSAAVDTLRCPLDSFPTMAAVTVHELDEVDFETGNQVPISWNVAEGWGDAVRIDLIDHLTGDVCLTITEETVNPSSFIWTAEYCPGPVAGYRIRVTDIASGARGETEESFVVDTNCAIAVTSPNGGETWSIGSTQTITWESSGDCGSTVRIELVINQNLCPIISESAPNIGHFTWNEIERCGGAVSGHRVRIIDLETGADDESDEPFDIVDAPCLTTVGETNTAKEAWGVDIQGDLAYVADGDFGLKIINIEQPAEPFLVGSVAIDGGKARGVVVAGNYAYVAAGGAGLQVVDISTPSTPSVVATVDTHNAFAVALAGNYAYVADVEAGLQIINIQAPTDPYIEGTYDTPWQAWGVAVVGRHAFVADGSYEGGLQIIDISLAVAPIFVGWVWTPGDASGVVISGDFAFVADGPKGLQVIDIKNPGNPVIVANADTGPESYALDLAGDYVLVADRFAGIQVVDVTSPLAPTVVDGVGTPGEANWILFDGDLSYVADYMEGLLIIDTSCYWPVFH